MISIPRRAAALQQHIDKIRIEHLELPCAVIKDRDLGTPHGQRYEQIRRRC